MCVECLSASLSLSQVSQGREGGRERERLLSVNTTRSKLRTNITLTVCKCWKEFMWKLCLCTREEAAGFPFKYLCLHFSMKIESR